MNAVEHADSFLLNRFRRFYIEVIRAKYLARSGARYSSTDSAETNSDGIPDHVKMTMTIQQRLLFVLEQQVVDAQRSGGVYGVSFYREAESIMAALADEIFLK